MCSRGSRLAQALPEAQVWAWSLAVASREADHAVVWSPDDAFFAGQHRLRAVFNMGAGVDRAIGSRVAQAVASFGYPVHGWSRSRKAIPGISAYARPGEFDAFLHATRVLICVLPLTAQTEGIVSATNLRKLKPGAYVINVGRSAHVLDTDQIAAKIRAVERGEAPSGRVDFGRGY